MKKIVRLMTEFITEAVLVSAYDIHYKLLNSRHLTFPSLIFLDSGGYEARIEHDLSEAYGQDYKPREWTREDHRKVLEEWQSDSPTVIVSYDNPQLHSAVRKQIRAALRLKEAFPNFPVEFLVKPEKKGKLIEPTMLEEVIADVRQFPIIGFTEHELDHRIIGRMEKIARVRRALDQAGIPSPIHIFGSLDSLSTALYFLSGAEVFDGLTWLRFGFYNGKTVYRQNYGVIQGENGILKSARELSHSMWKENYYYLESFRDQMRNYVRSGKLDSFEHISAHLETAFHQLESRVLV